MSSIVVCGALFASLVACGIDYRHNVSWQDVKASAPYWKPKLAARRSCLPLPRAIPKPRELSEKAFFNQPHRPIPLRDSEEAKKEEAQNKAREEAINRLVKSGICRGC
jgi:hypothetical protein